MKTRLYNDELQRHILCTDVEQDIYETIQKVLDKYVELVDFADLSLCVKEAVDFEILERKLQIKAEKKI